MIEIKIISITELKTDVIVNAANQDLWMGGGVCGAIFNAAGASKLQEACDKIGHCDTGDAVITSGFNLCKYIIHAVGPIYKDGKNNEAVLLESCYKKALDLAKEYNCKSIGFPLISSGIFAYPIKEAWQVAIKAIIEWLYENDYAIDIVFAVLSENVEKIGSQILKESL